MSASGGRSMGLSRRGLPSSMRVGSVELLHAPVQLRLWHGAEAELRWAPSSAGALAGAVDASGSVRWSASSCSDGVGIGLGAARRV